MCDKDCGCGGKCEENCKCNEQKKGKTKKNNFPFRRNDLVCICDPEKDMDEPPNCNCPVHKIKK